MNGSRMSLRLYPLLRRIRKTHSPKFSTAVETKDEQISSAQVCSFRTTENNPANHSVDHFARLYTVSSDTQQQIFQHGGFPPVFRQQITTFQDCSLLIRQPALEILTYLNQADYTRPVNKYVIYGKHGTGKSLTLAHVIHYAFVQKFVLLHIHWAAHWFKDVKEVAPSALTPGCIDLPIDAGLWLRTFKAQNLQLLSQLDLKTTEDYVWNQREMLSKGAPLLELIDFGINRVKFACGAVNGLLNELKRASIAGKCKTMVLIDGFNAFTSSYTRIKDDNKVMMLPKQVTLARPFYDMTKDDWCNGAVVLTVDTLANKERRESHLPRYLLGKEGFEHLDPFLPILTDDYTVAEFETIVEYYKERKWIRNITPSGQRELELITHKNPLGVVEQCKFL
ncbi:hypothetical protein DMN91_011728 [Ooceraea biroi]|uniref:Small ribosomal subunit protein mS29 n=1 Tax=Ooceraea biroi TaxID=2015173 RepID=A0A3L8D6C9_OOCBI|nr:28S ribosomal protein S29, mitochondrial [Ooceraea biroi]RLU15970.1 hypothetical protein DMN91_011728 [Ooceraea biroi]